jgi:hypothetical protein
MSENNHASSNGLWSKIGRFLPKYLYALGASFYLFTVGTFSRNHRFLIFLIAKHFRMRIKMEESRLPTTPLSSVIDTHVDLHLFELIGEGGNVSFLELMVIASMARRAIPLVAFEIGTFDGRTALNIAANLTPDGRVYTLDLPKTGLQETRFELVPGEIVFVDKESSGSKFAGTAYAARITQLFGDSATFDFSQYEGQMGLVFVDGSHAFEYVLQDSITALRLAAPEQSVILWHDYQEDWPGVMQVLNQLHDSGGEFSDLRRIEGTSLVMLRREKNARRSP